MAVFLLINSVGYTVYAHYCDDELQETSILVNTNKSCCADEEEVPAEEKSMEMGCCAEQNVWVKIKDHFVKAEQDFNLTNLPLVYISHHIFYADDYSLSLQCAEQTITKLSDPPDISTPERTILFSVFRI
jgi:hypothetical protein